ncbi:hypothetical protein GCM10011390_19980 [Aureimonas endophytica]|uniref:SGNH hydrolase-type esterase domain-containing protein n=2 Tax=Aureimonas endophytica TaxID=2027858 RepID=A0A917E3E3_9HYPH|nr:hypothetical protein GCM10011390_19980 [Aureimonas endophytica]
MNEAKAEAPPLHIVAFGTSLTARGGWQPDLRQALAACLGRDVAITTVARSGSTSAWALANVETVVAARPDIVLVEFSVNDAALDRLTTPGRSRAAMAAVLGRLREGLPDARVFSMAMNPIHGLRGLMRPFLDSYVEAHRRIAAGLGQGFIDFRPFWAEFSDAALARMIPDGAHPQPEAASAIMVPRLVEVLSEGRCPAGREHQGAPGRVDQ